MLRKVALQGFTFGLTSKTDNTPITSGTTTGYIVKDGITQLALTNTPSHMGNGMWSVDLTATEMDANVIGLTFLNAAAYPYYTNLYTIEGGVNQVTITITDGTDPIPYTEVFVYNQSNTTFLAGGETNTLGQVIFNLDDGTYSIRLRKFNVTFTTPRTLTVSTDTIVTYTGAVTSITNPQSSNVCRVYEYCFSQSGTIILSSVTATAVLVRPPINIDDKLHSVAPVNGTYSTSTGLVYWDLVQGATAQIVIKELGVNKRINVPTTSTARLSDI